MNIELDLDRSSAVPLYQQLADQIERAIRSGAIEPGAEIGNEIRLARRLGVSRPTIRQAILRLVEKGLLVRRRGIGTHVVDPPVARPLRLTSLFDDLTATHQRPRTALLAFNLVPAPPEVADVLGLAVDEPVIHLLRLRFAADQPLAIMENYLPEDLIGIGEMDLAGRGLYQLMRTKGVNIRVAKQKIGARTGTPEECALLGEKRGSPVLTMERAAHDDSGRAVEWGRHAYRASQYSFEVTLVEH